MDYLKLYIEFYLRVPCVPINQFEILLSIIQYLKLQWMSTKLTSFKKLYTGLLKLSNVLLWYEMVKKNIKYCTKKTISIVMPTESYWLIPIQVFPFHC